MVSYCEITCEITTFFGVFVFGTPSHAHVSQVRQAPRIRGHAQEPKAAHAITCSRGVENGWFFLSGAPGSLLHVLHGYMEKMEGNVPFIFFLKDEYDDLPIKTVVIFHSYVK